MPDVSVHRLGNCFVRSWVNKGGWVKAAEREQCWKATTPPLHALNKHTNMTYTAAPAARVNNAHNNRPTDSIMLYCLLASFVIFRATKITLRDQTALCPYSCFYVRHLVSQTLSMSVQQSRWNACLQANEFLLKIMWNYTYFAAFTARDRRIARTCYGNVAGCLSQPVFCLND